MPYALGAMPMAYGTKHFKSMNLVQDVNHLVPYALGATPMAYGTRHFKSI